MSARRRNGGRRGPATATATADENRRLLAAAGLTVAAVTLLILGAALQVEPTAPVGLDTPDAAREEPDWTEPAPREVAPAPAPDPEPDALGGRALRDHRRLSERGAAWTAQLLVACDPKNVRRLVQRDGGSDALYLLPVTLDERSCFRVCWGRYPTRDDAGRASDLPASLRAALDEPPRPREVADLLH